MSFSHLAPVNIRKSRWLLLATLMLAALLTGQAGAQTPFALRNVGQRLATDDARMSGRGGWGMAVTDSLNPGFKNLASITSLRHLVLKFTGYGDNMESSDGTSERMNSRVIAPEIRVASPVMKGRLALTAGLVSYRSTQYHTYSDTAWGSVWDDEITGNNQYDRVGSRVRVPLGGALKILPGISLSGAVNLEGGSKKETVNNFFTSPGTPSGPDYQPNIKETNDEFHGTSQTWGILLDPFSWFQLGASWTPAHRIEVDRKVTHFGVTGRYESSFTMQMPDEYMAGFQLRPIGRFRLGADAQYMPFSEFTGPEDMMVEMEDEYTLSVGLERIAGRERHGGASNLPIRVGASVRQWAYTVGGEPIEERTISIGTGFSFRQHLGALDLAFSYSEIGELEKNGMESTVYRLTLSVTGLERWW
jgi:hypothetical protein